MRPRMLSTTVIALVLLGGLAVPMPVMAGGVMIESATVSGSPFQPGGMDIAQRVDLSVAVGRAAQVSVDVIDFDGHVVRRLAIRVARPAGAWALHWKGRDSDNAPAPDGPYRLRIRAWDPAAPEAPPQRLTLRITKAERAVYAPDPSAVTVLINAGHGGSDTGAPYAGLAEETINLDISLRLRAMLEAAGARVVMVRSTDAEVNDPPMDVTGNGTIDQWDELAARVDIGNLARADVHVNPHNNASDCHCASGTGMYTWFGRTWSPEGIALAQQILDAHMRELEPFATATWQPRSRGVIERKFAAVRPYSASNWPRPSLQPTMLGESLFGDVRPEGRLLQTAAVRQALAVAYYDGLARWFASRTYGVRYEMLEAPSSAAAGSAVDYRVRLTNNGNSVSDGWTLEARSVLAVPLYDGSGLAGDLRGSVAVPDDLAPGESVDLVIPSTAPPDAGDWLMKLDITLLGTDTMAFHGVVSPQLPLVTSLPLP